MNEGSSYKVNSNGAFSTDGKEKLFGYYVLSGVNWVCIVIADKAELSYEISAVSNYIQITMLISGIGAVLIGTLFALRLVKPVKNLTKEFG